MYSLPIVSIARDIFKRSWNSNVQKPMSKHGSCANAWSTSGARACGHSRGKRQHLRVVERMCYSWFDGGMQLYSHVSFHKKSTSTQLGENDPILRIFCSSGLQPPSRFSFAKRSHEQTTGHTVTYVKLIESKGNGQTHTIHVWYI